MSLVSQLISKPHGLRSVIAALAILGVMSPAIAKDQVRIGVPTKAFWPTIVVKAAIEQKLFEKEGLTPELTIYRGGGEAFEALSANAADIVLVVPSFPAVARSKGINAKVVAAGGVVYSGWHLVVTKDSPVKSVQQLNGKNVGITSTGSQSDLAARWAMHDRKVNFNLIPVGGGGMVPNLLSGNVDAVVLYSPLTFQMLKTGEVRSIIDFAAEIPQHLTTGWIVNDKLIAEKPQVVQKTVNAIFGGLHYLRNNRAAAIKLIATNNEIPDEIAAEEYDKTIMKLVADGTFTTESVQQSLDLSKMIGMKGLSPASEIVSMNFKPVPTKP